jgi:hypothetical protein
MNDHSEALSILQKARDALTARLTQRIIESEHEIVEDAEGNSYFSEIETIYEQLGGRLAHLNAMLSNLPPAPPQHSSEAAASEVIYADLASSPSSTLDVDATGPLTLLALPAPMTYDDARVEPMVEVFAGIVLYVKSGDLTSGARLISELFDVKPSLARRGAQAFERQLDRYPDLARRFEQFGASIDATNEYAAATLLGECFEFQPIDALLLVRALKQHNDPGTSSDSVN